jgi:DNA-binding response OmpR family regulator
MLVDDEIAMLMLVSMTMKRSGFYVIEADNAPRALDLLETSMPDLIILDVMMPGMSGIELCAQIRARPETAHTPIIMLSALTDSKSMKRAKEAGANEYLSKLTPHHQLVSKVHDMLKVASAT